MDSIGLASEKWVKIPRKQKNSYTVYGRKAIKMIYYTANRNHRRHTMEEYSRADARAFIEKKFDQQGDFGILSREVFEKMLDKVMDLDEAFMAQTGVNDGAVYDDDQAFEYMMKELQTAFPEQKMYAMRFVEDYMEYDEAYLESVGLIDWE